MVDIGAHVCLLLSRETGQICSLVSTVDMATEAAHCTT